jgi:phosphoglycolate phosphatase
MTTSTRLAVFDIDGTIVDSQHNIVASMLQACERHQVAPPSPAAIRQIIGLSLSEAVERLLPGADPDLQRAVAESYKQGFAELRTSSSHFEPLFPGVVAALDALGRQGWLLAVATGKSRRGLLAMIERHNLEGRFISLQTADDNPGKPHPAMLRRAMADAGAKAGESVMIGDTSFDMLMGREAGTRTVGVAWGYHPAEELIDAGAERVVASYPELLLHLSTLFGSAP